MPRRRRARVAQYPPCVKLHGIARSCGHTGLGSVALRRFRPVLLICAAVLLYSAFKLLLQKAARLLTFRTHPPSAPAPAGRILTAPHGVASAHRVRRTTTTMTSPTAQ